MLITGFDKEVQKHINFLQNENKCVIAVSDDADGYHMDVLYHTGEVVKDIFLCEKGNKYRLMMAIRNYINGRKENT